MNMTMEPREQRDMTLLRCTQTITHQNEQKGKIQNKLFPSLINVVGEKTDRQKDDHG